MWGGRFSKPLDERALRYTTSLPVDRRLFEWDVLGSIAHARMLGRQDIISQADAETLVAGLIGLLRDPPPLDGPFEDIHSLVESTLGERVGDAAGRLHTARSRNDQVATDTRLFARAALIEGVAGIVELQAALLRAAEEHGQSIMPGYTHLQRAQPVLLGHHLLAYVEMLERDLRRLGTAGSAGDWPLGSGAATGVSYAIDRKRTARALGGPGAEPTANSLDAVSSRDGITHWVYAAAQCAVTLSRLGEDIVLWTTREFGFARLSDRVSTGSSIMPQKRNPDGAELLRAKCARITGDLMTLLMLQKGLPLGYSKDLQEDKAAFFDAEEELLAMLNVARAMLEHITFDRARMRAAITEASGYMLATEAADWLAKRGIPFREAHRAVGALVREAERRGVALEALPLVAFREAHPRFDRTVYRSLTPEAAVAARTAVGGTAPKNVARETARWAKALGIRVPRGRTPRKRA